MADLKDRLSCLKLAAKAECDKADAAVAELYGKIVTAQAVALIAGGNQDAGEKKQMYQDLYDGLEKSRLLVHEILVVLSQVVAGAK